MKISIKTAIQTLSIIGIAVSVLVSVSCIFDTEPPLPGYPAKIDESISFSGIGSPDLCKCMSDNKLALVAAGSDLVVVDMVNGNKSVIDIGLEVDDIADSDGNGFGYVLADSLVYPVNLSSATAGNPINVGVSCSYISLSSDADTAWLAMDNDSIGILDLTTSEFTTVKSISIKNCQGIAIADSILFIADGSSNLILAYETDQWSEVGRIPVPGAVQDLFPGISGYICAIVDGSNELWFIKSDNCSLYKMITFPVIPTAAASMPDASYAYAACPGTGMVIVAESGQMELRTADFGLPSSIDVTSDGSMAVVCSPENEAVYILVR